MTVNYAVAANRTGQPALAIELLEPFSSDAEAGDNLFATLSSAAHLTGDTARARKYGQRSLELKLAETASIDLDHPVGPCAGAVIRPVAAGTQCNCLLPVG